MPHANQAVLDMIDQLRARLADLEEDVRAFDGDLSDIAPKLDRVDDRVYLMEREIAKRAAGGDGDAEDDAEGDTAEDAEAGDDDDEGGMNILTPEAKEKLGETVGDMRAIGREAAETFSELNEAFSDIAGPFQMLSGKGRRRF